MPPGWRPPISVWEALKCLYPDSVRMFICRGNLKCLLRVSHLGQPLPPASHQQSHSPRRWLYSPHQQCPAEIPEPKGSIPGPALNQVPQETHSADDGLYRHVPQPQTPAQASEKEEADPGETLINGKNPKIDIHHTAGRTFSDDSNFCEFRDLINNRWQPFYCSDNFKQTIRCVEAHLPNAQIGHHFNEGRCKVPKHFCYTSERTMYNQIIMVDNQRPKWWEASISTQTVGCLSIFETL